MLSRETKDILIDLNGYLLAKGKDEKEVNELLDELATHAVEAEKEGKLGKDIFGEDPKAFADELASELAGNRRETFQLVSTFLLGSLFYIILADAINQSLAYSWYALIGYPLILLVNLITTVVMFRATAFQSKANSLLYCCLIGTFQFTAIFTVSLLNNKLGIPVLILTPDQRWAAIILMFLFIVVINTIMKAHFISLLPIIFFGPQLLLEWFGWTTPVVLLSQNVISCLIIVLFMFFKTRQSNKEKAS
ncbi:HAAS domain-containing protein [Bacillus sp. NPDC077027]|uniref:HAAS domain-containing protein n=1 Tax=Bacillus sp. NPDC077027 TaxID=3390548 RepID=UPI003D05BBC6